eukprot:UN31932
MAVFLCAIFFDYFFTRAGENQESIIHVGLNYFYGFAIGHLTACFSVYTFVNLIVGDVPFWGERKLAEPSVLKVIYYEVMNAAVDAAGLLVLFKYFPYDLHGAHGKLSYGMFGASMFFILPLVDFIFYFVHKLLLHDTFLWFCHRGHHTVYQPTVLTARNLDGLDWFLKLL